MRLWKGCSITWFLVIATTSMAQDNLAPNPGFDTDTSGWSPGQSVLSWNANDREGGASGALQVDYDPETPRVNEGAWVCFPAQAGTLVEAGAWALQAADQPADARAITVAIQYTSEDCSSGSALFHYSNRPATPGEWALQNLDFKTIYGTKSVGLFLSTYPSGNNVQPVSALFDDAYYREVATGEFAINPSVSTSWYDPEQSGHGVLINLIGTSQNGAWMCWYTFDNDQAPAWICALGRVIQVLDRLQFDEAFTVEGGAFPPNFDPEQVSSVPWGSITIDFDTCNDATMTWTTDRDGFQSGAMPLKRLLNIWDLPCE